MLHSLVFQTLVQASRLWAQGASMNDIRDEVRDDVMDDIRDIVRSANNTVPV